MLYGKRIRIGDLLIKQGLITEQQLLTALNEQKIRKTKLGETLIALNYVSHQDFATVFHDQLGIESVNLNETGLEDSAIRLVGEDIMKKHGLVPFSIDETNANVLNVAMSDPLDLNAIDDVSLITNMDVRPYFASTAQIALQLDRMFGKKQAMEAAEQYQKEHADEMMEAVEAEANIEVDNAPIVKIVRSMLEQAVRQGASDIHIEPFERLLRIRYRIDGVLQDVMDYNPNLLPAMVARVKIISGLDISEKRKPQDGRLSVYVDNREYDVRVSVLPTVYGEKTVMRLAAKDGLTREKKYLGLTETDEERLDDILKNPHGIILVTGPTGSGKSTTVYTILSELNSIDVNIVTVEDPVEANVDGINQVQVNVKADMTFANALRSILRQDPDIIMIGEIRDNETAEIAVKASITGHLVISTLHTNSTAATITRLLDMNIEPYLLGDSIVGIIAQRLIRLLCPACKKPREATDDEKRLLGLYKEGLLTESVNEENVTGPSEVFEGPAVEPSATILKRAVIEARVTLYEPAGCPACSGIGYKGRTAVYEVMTVTSKLRSLINDRANADEMKDQAVREGMNTLRMAATREVLQGKTAINELIKVAYESD
ncbi:MAG: GspE/PulE family protein [Lachnospiraceae bacterium]|nr:GspE/PulE family protein [Lachnospiraceae bacterium]